MSGEQGHDYGLEKDGAGGQAHEPLKPQTPDIPRSGDVEPLPLELEPEEPKPTPGRTFTGRIPSDEPSPAGASSVKDLDVCPNCGASMRGTTDLICLRCGFDLKTMRVLKTATGETTASEENETGEARPALIKPGTGDLWLPGGLAAIGALIVIIGYLAGLPGLFPRLEAAAIEQNLPFEASVGARFTGLLRYAAFVAMWTACAMGGLFFLAQLLGMRFVAEVEHIKLAAVRSLALVTTARVAALINLPSAPLEWTLETAIELAVFIGLAIALFRLKPRDAATLAAATVILFMVLWLVANMVLWATG